MDRGDTHNPASADAPRSEQQLSEAFEVQRKVTINAIKVAMRPWMAIPHLMDPTRSWSIRGTIASALRVNILQAIDTTTGVVDEDELNRVCATPDIQGSLLETPMREAAKLVSLVKDMPGVEAPSLIMPQMGVIAPCVELAYWEVVKERQS